MPASLCLAVGEDWRCCYFFFLLWFFYAHCGADINPILAELFCVAAQIFFPSKKKQRPAHSAHFDDSMSFSDSWRQCT